MRDESERRSAAIHAALGQIPRFDLPARTYYLLSGPTRAVARLTYPGSDGWRNPDLFWPDDRRWFVATDVDVPSLYIGGSPSFIAELVDSVATSCKPAALDSPIELE